MANVDILIAVDVAGALSANTLSGYLYMVDTNKFLGSYQQGSNELVTKLNDGDHIVWRVIGIDPATSLTIKSFSGTAISGGNIMSLFNNPSYNPAGCVWEANFHAPSSQNKVQYSMTLQFQGGKTLDFDPYLQWTGK